MQKYAILPLMGQEIETPDGKGEVMSANYLKDLREVASPDFVFKVRSLLGKDYERRYFRVTVKLLDTTSEDKVRHYHSWEVNFEVRQQDDEAPPWR